MTPDELKTIRKALGLSHKGLALALGKGPESRRTVRRWENGEFNIPKATIETLWSLVDDRVNRLVCIREDLTEELITLSRPLRATHSEKWSLTGPVDPPE